MDHIFSYPDDKKAQQPLERRERPRTFDYLHKPYVGWKDPMDRIRRKPRRPKRDPRIAELDTFMRDDR